MTCKLRLPRRTPFMPQWPALALSSLVVLAAVMAGPVSGVAQSAEDPAAADALNQESGNQESGADSETGADSSTQTIERLRETAVENSPVILMGRVEDVDRENSTFTLSDESGEIDISTIAPPETLEEGQQVRISGTISESASGGDRSIVATTVEVVGTAEDLSEGRKGSHRAKEAGSRREDSR
jgi:uncharacterized protein YdeI (BOF family)